MEDVHDLAEQCVWLFTQIVLDGSDEYYSLFRQYQETRRALLDMLGMDEDHFKVYVKRLRVPYQKGRARFAMEIYGEDPDDSVRLSGQVMTFGPFDYHASEVR